MFDITDGEYILAKQRNEAEGALGAANASIRAQNAEIVKLRRALTAARAEIVELKQENQTLGMRLIALLRPKH